ncbi:PIR protein [Plasmodium ovale]|nr:PIR protein [Plasmodium ovale]
MEDTSSDSTDSQRKCDNYIDKTKNDGPDILKLCQKSKNIFSLFKYTSNDIFKNDNKDRCCNYFKYWLNDKTKKFSVDSENVNIHYHNLIIYNIGLDDDYKCRKISNFRIYGGNLDMHKNLFFHAENLHWIKEMYNEVESVSTTSFYDYLKECSDFYNEIICTNTCKDNKLYKSKLKRIQQEFNSTLAHLLTRGHKIELSPLETPVAHKCKQGRETIKCNLDIRQSEWKPEDHFDDDYFEDTDTLIEFDSDDTEDMSSTVIVSIIFSILTIISFLFFMHKFTTLGSRLQHFIQRKKRMWSNLNEQTEEFLNTPENQEIHSENTYNLAYHSA